MLSSQISFTFLTQFSPQTPHGSLWSTRSKSQQLIFKAFFAYFSPKKLLQKSAASALVILNVSPWNCPPGKMALISASMWLKISDSLVRFLLQRGDHKTQQTLVSTPVTDRPSDADLKVKEHLKENLKENWRGFTEGKSTWLSKIYTGSPSKLPREDKALNYDSWGVGGSH